MCYFIKNHLNGQFEFFLLTSESFGRSRDHMRESIIQDSLCYIGQ